LETLLGARAKTIWGRVVIRGASASDTVYDLRSGGICDEWAQYNTRRSDLIEGNRPICASMEKDENNDDFNDDDDDDEK